MKRNNDTEQIEGIVKPTKPVRTYSPCEITCGMKSPCGNKHCSLHPKSVAPVEQKTKRGNFCWR